MKPKDFNKKLTLKRKTIVNLDTREMNLVKGGDSSPTFCCTLSGCLTFCGPAGAYC